MPGGFYVMRSEAVGWPPWQEFNGDGLRDRTRPREKPEGVWRVAILGDSVTLGDGLKPYEAYPAGPRGAPRRGRAEGRGHERGPVGLVHAPGADRLAADRPGVPARPGDPRRVPERHPGAPQQPEPAAALAGLAPRALGPGAPRSSGPRDGRSKTSRRLFETPDAPRVREALDALLRGGPRPCGSEVEADGAALRRGGLPVPLPGGGGGAAAGRAGADRVLLPLRRDAPASTCSPPSSGLGPSAFLGLRPPQPGGVGAHRRHAPGERAAARGVLEPGRPGGSTSKGSGGPAPRRCCAGSRMERTPLSAAGVRP